MADSEKKQRKAKTAKGIGRGNNPNSRKNLKIYKKGESGNLQGKPQGAKHRATFLNKWLPVLVKFDNINPNTKEKIFPEMPAEFQISLEDKVALGLITQAYKGNIAAIKELHDSLYGKQSETLEVGNKNDEPLKIIVEYVEKPVNN